eukprot:scaffold2334_cov118-Cylindrotheca_fusiformis.AAC.23
MGITSSTPEPQLSRRQQDIKYLGDRMPFGDAELIQLHNAYHERLDLVSTKQHISFLVDIGVLCFSESSKAEERKLILEAVESKILSPNFGNRLYETSFLSSGQASDYDSSSSAMPANDDDDFTRLSKIEAFCDGVALCGRRGASKTLSVLVKACQQHPASEENGGSDSSQSTLIDPVELVDMGYRVALASAFLSAASKDEDVGRYLPPETVTSHPGLQALSNSLKAFATKRKQRIERSSTPSSESLSLVSAEDVAEWGEHVAPMFAASLSSLIHQVFFPQHPPPPTRSSFEFPILSAESTFFDTTSCPFLFSFACMSPALSGEYYRLYTSASDGLSFNRLQNSLVGYGGPTLLIVRSTNDSIFGAYTSSAWKESKDFYGNTDCFLYQVMPTTAVYHPSGNGRNFMYCNSRSRSRGYDKQAHGIGFGGTVDEPRLFISESFDHCQAAWSDMTFESGRLLKLGSGGNNSKTFDIDSLEVWGVGGTEMVTEALGARDKERDVRQAAVNRARKVDKAAFLDDFQSGLIDSKAFAHRSQIQGRDGACVGVDDLRKFEDSQKAKRSTS